MTEVRQPAALLFANTDWYLYNFRLPLARAVRAAGYVGATTVVAGWARPDEDAFTLPRLRVLAGTSPSALLAQIAANRGSSVPPASYLSAA